ncbi:hypothetical protein Tco_1110557 [Tanacetum coccineum]|uniref:Uncharacterized protein n=1 Tax=Tanacetum coccineum TaxID=301880 RepID=A0ABQ5IJ53_9ASTR
MFFSTEKWSSIYRTGESNQLSVGRFPGGPDGGEGYCKLTLGGGGGESFWEGGDDFGVDGLRFHTCLTDILGFLEKLEWWFEQDIDEEGVRFEGDKDGDEV